VVLFFFYFFSFFFFFMSVSCIQCGLRCGGLFGVAVSGFWGRFLDGVFFSFWLVFYRLCLGVVYSV